MADTEDTDTDSGEKSNTAYNRKFSTKTIDSSSDPISVASLLGFGTYQKWLTAFFIFLVGPFTAFNNTAQFLILLEPEFTCYDPLESFEPQPQIDDPHHPAHFYLDELRTKPNPLNLFIKINRTCTFDNGTSCGHLGFKYEYDFIYPTIVSQNDWVCDNDMPKYYAHSIYWSGAVIGVLALGHVSDTYGRIPTIILSHLILGSAGTLTTFCEQHLFLFLLMRFFMGFVVLTQASCTYVLVLESVPNKYRSMISNMYLMIFSVFSAFLPWFAYYLQDWEVLSMLTSIPALTIPMIAHITPESVKWLLSEGKVDEAKIAIKRVARINGDVVTNEMLTHWDKDKLDLGRKAGLRDIFKYPRWCVIFALTSLNWLCINFAFIGGNGYAAMSTDNPYMMLTLNAIIDAVSSITADYLMRVVFGRKMGTIICCSAAGFFYVLAGVLPRDWMVCTLVLLMSARFVATIGYNIQFLYAAEVFPTEIRGRAYAVRTSMGAIGALISPQFVALQKFHKAIPLFSFGAASFISTFIMFFLPESKGLRMPQTLIDGELFGLVHEAKKKAMEKIARNNVDLTISELIQNHNDV